MPRHLSPNTSAKPYYSETYKEKTVSNVKKQTDVYEMRGLAAI